VLVGEMRQRFERHGTLKIIYRTGGGLLVGAGVLTVLSRPAA
jgi:threonine/homoserine/homoserine lactone efflux protein